VFREKYKRIFTPNSGWYKKITRRTLQEYRREHIIAYIELKGKILYKESDIQKLLSRNYHKAF